MTTVPQPGHRGEGGGGLHRLADEPEVVHRPRLHLGRVAGAEGEHARHAAENAGCTRSLSSALRFKVMGGRGSREP